MVTELNGIKMLFFKNSILLTIFKNIVSLIHQSIASTSILSPDNNHGFVPTLAALRNFFSFKLSYQLLQLCREKICLKVGEHCKMIKYGTFIQVREYQQRVVGETPKSTIKG